MRSAVIATLPTHGGCPVCATVSRTTSRSCRRQCVGQRGRVVANPNSPAGGGGPGNFYTAGTRQTGPGAADLPPPLAPATRTLDPLDIEHVTRLQAQTAAAKKNPAPRVTADSTQTINGISVTLKADVTALLASQGPRRNPSTSLISSTPLAWTPTARLAPSNQPSIPFRSRSKRNLEPATPTIPPPTAGGPLPRTSRPATSLWGSMSSATGRII